MSDTCTITATKVLSFENIKRISIGDPMYFEDIDNPKTSKEERKNLKKYILEENIPNGLKGRIEVNKETCSYDDDFFDANETFENISINIAISKDYFIKCGDTKKSLMEVLCDGCTLKSTEKNKVIVKQGELGCDTACFSIEVDNRWDEFRTGADGGYGQWLKMNCKPISETKSSTWGYAIFLSLDGDLFDFDEVVNSLKYLFDAKEV